MQTPTLAAALVLIPVLAFGYAYAGYPALLWIVARARRRRAPFAEPAEWPRVSITVPAYNEEGQIRGMIESLLAIDYPADRRQILVVSDASTDATDDIVREYAGRGVELLALTRRGGKGAAESAAAPRLTGDIIVNTDASIRIHPAALRALVAAFSDPEVGVASGRDVSMGRLHDDANRGESGYVGYEMEIRRLETAISGIVGASGCFYAIRAHLHRVPLRGALSRDFASAIIAREHGYRAVSVHSAICYVPRAPSLRREYARKVRTITRGVQTLAAKRHLLDPFRFGPFAWMLFSHKVCRWLAPWTAPAGIAGLALLSPAHLWARALLGAGAVVLFLAGLGWALAERPRVPRVLAVPAFAVTGNLAVVHACLRALHGNRDAVWEPTRRETMRLAS